MDAQNFLRHQLYSHLTEAKTKNPAFSLRAFSKRLDIHPAALSQILNSKRSVSKKLALALAERLAWSPEVTQKLQNLFEARKNNHSSLELDRAPIDIDHYYLVADWVYYATLSFCETKAFDGTPQSIQEKLGLSKKKTQEVIQRLIKLQLLKQHPENGKIQHAGKSIVCPDNNKGSTWLKRRHDSNLDAAKESLYADSVNRRDFTFVTMGIDPARIPQAKLKIRRFLNEICQFLETGERSEVYEICVQLFPRTNRS